MNKFLIILGLITISLSGFSQKVRIKDDIATADGIPFVKCTSTLLDNSVTIARLNSTQDEIFATYLE